MFNLSLFSLQLMMLNDSTLNEQKEEGELVHVRWNEDQEKCLGE